MDAIESLGQLPGHVKILRANTVLNTWSLIQSMDYGLTVRGTIGMELPCFGIPVITAGSGRFSNYGFTIDPKDKKEYEETLLNIHNVKPLDEYTMELAMKHAFYVFLKRTVSFDDIFKMTTDLSDPNHPLHHNIIFKNGFQNNIQNSHTVKEFRKWFLESRSEDFING